MHWTRVALALLAVAPTLHADAAYPKTSKSISARRNASATTFLEAKIRRHWAKWGTLMAESNAPDRLSGEVIPLLYQLHIDVDFNDTSDRGWSYTGSVDIDIMAFKRTDNITLHLTTLERLNKSSAYVSSSGQNINVTDITKGQNERQYEQITLQLGKTLIPKRKYTLHLDFAHNGIYSSGIYAWKYRDATVAGMQWFVYSSFYPSNARDFFPCFDEPGMRAPFAISITHNSGYRALSNMPVESTKRKSDHKVTDVFQTSPEMSTHNVVIVVTKFSENMAHPQISKVWARNTTFDQGIAHRQEIGYKALLEMQNFTNMNFPLPKLDHVLFRGRGEGDFEWGLTLQSEGKGDNLTYMADMSRSVAQQWFGGLVSIDWWSYRWLNEGFATFFQYYLTEKISNGTWAMWDRFIPDQFRQAMDFDADPRHTLPMTGSKHNYNYYYLLRERILKAKGSAFVRMMAELLTEDKFTVALRKYLDDYAFRSAKPEDLFEILQEASIEGTAFPSNISFTDFAKSWTEQSGFPLVNVTRNYQTGEVVLKQESFFTENADNDGAKRRWWIPLSWMAKNATVEFKSQQWLRADSDNATLHIPPGEDSFMLNPRSIGFFRVNYDDVNWMLLAKDLRENPDRFPVANRAQIIDDAAILVETGHLNVTFALEIMRLLEKEQAVAVWKNAMSRLWDIRDNIASTSVNPLLEKFTRQLLTFAYNATYGLYKLYYVPEQDLEATISVAAMACTSGVHRCIEDATKVFEEYKNELKKLRMDIRDVVLCGTFKAANETRFWEIREAMRSQVVFYYSQALVNCTDDNLLIKEHMIDVLSARSAFSKDPALRNAALEGVFRSSSHFTAKFKFLKEYFNKLCAKIGKGQTRDLVNRMIITIRTRTQYDKVATWLKDVYVPVMGDDAEFTVKLLGEVNYQWNQRHLTDVKNWIENLFSNHPPKTTTPQPTTTEATTAKPHSP